MKRRRDRRSRRARRDPERTIDGILWVARQAEESDDARQVLHDMLLEAHDVSIPEILRRRERGKGLGLGNLVTLKTLADDYAWHVLEAEEDAAADGRKRVVVFTPRWLAELSPTISRAFSPSAFSFMRHSYATEYLRGPAIAVYTTRAGEWGPLKPYGT